MTGFMTLGLKRTHDTLRKRDVHILGSMITDQKKSNSPLSVAIILDVVFALAKGVPELDRPVAGARDNLPVVGGEADGEDIRGVTDEAAGGRAGVEVPQAQRVVPGGGEGELAIRGDDDVRDEVVVSVEDALGVTVLVLLASELPDDDRLVCASNCASASRPVEVVLRTAYAECKNAWGGVRTYLGTR